MSNITNFRGLKPQFKYSVSGTALNCLSITIGTIFLSTVPHHIHYYFDNCSAYRDFSTAKDVTSLIHLLLI